MPAIWPAKRVNIMLNTDTAKTLGQRIKLARQSADMSQADLARSVGVTRGAVTHWEKDSIGNLKNEHLYAVADATRVNPRWLATGKGSMRPLDNLPPSLIAKLQMLSDDELREVMDYTVFRFESKSNES